jgi:hypothetical protein
VKSEKRCAESKYDASKLSKRGNEKWKMKNKNEVPFRGFRGKG